MDDAVFIVGAPAGVVALDIGHAGAPAEHDRHWHGLGQLQVILHGLMAVDVGDGWWIMPPGRVGWLPPRWPHAGRSFGAISVLVLHLDDERAKALPPVPSVVALSPFVGALFQRLRDIGDGDGHSEAGAGVGRRDRILDVLTDELTLAREEPLHLPMPADRRLSRMCQALMEDPADGRDLDQWAVAIGLSRRSLTRHLVAETGLSFGRWRTQARLMAAVRMLSENRSVTEVALTVGFDSVSAFIAGFRRHFGTTPARFLRGRGLPGDVGEVQRPGVRSPAREGGE
ncbi:MAG: AraC family transcriptional regulator [Telmatospirillum sp.]|nr:AraC family transcriptional regulator [Telmatospirillum sp.]